MCPTGRFFSSDRFSFASLSRPGDGRIKLCLKKSGAFGSIRMINVILGDPNVPLSLRHSSILRGAGAPKKHPVMRRLRCPGLPPGAPGAPKSTG